MNRNNTNANLKNIAIILAILLFTQAILILFILNLFFGRPTPEYAGEQIPEMMRIARMEADW